MLLEIDLLQRLLLLAALSGVLAMAADRTAGTATAGRSPVVARHGMVATSQPLAAQAGLRVLQQGGNAFDAAVATAAVLGVVEPMMTGVGGDLFVLAWHAESGELVGLNASGRAPTAVDPAFFRDKDLEAVPVTGPFSVTVPGAVDGWTTLLERYGLKPLEELLEPAIEYASEGFPVSEIISGDWRRGAREHADKPPFARVYLNADRQPPAHGDVARNPDLAETLRRIAERGRAGFYEGETAERIVQHLNEQGWPLSLEDLAGQRAEWVEPISTSYRGVEVYELPPNGQGLAALEMLNILEGFDLASLGHNSAEYVHLLVEAKKLAFADLAAWLADPTEAELPVPTLISKEYARRQRARIDRERAADDVRTGVENFSDTVYLTVVDEQRNAVSFIQSVFHNFGSGEVPPGTGVVLQNRGALFTLEQGHPNQIAPRKRPYHTIIPAMAMRDGKPWLSFGVMGGDMQPQGHVQVLANMIDFGMNVQEAGEAARVRHIAGAGAALESGFDPTVIRKLADMGHSVLWVPGGFGGYQAIEIDWERGVLFGGTDPRKDGQVAAW